MSKQTDAQGETTYNKDDKHPYRRKVQLTKSAELSLKKPTRLGIRWTKKHGTIFPIRERRKNLPLSERKQVTIGGFVYKRSEGHLGLSGKWYKLYKGEKVEDAIKNRGLKAVLVDSLPIEEK